MTKYRLLLDKDLVLNELKAFKASNGGRIVYSTLEVDDEVFANRLKESDQLEIIVKEDGYTLQDIKQDPLKIFFKCFYPTYELDQLDFVVEDILADGNWEKIREWFIEIINPALSKILMKVKDFVEDNGGLVVSETSYDFIDFECDLNEEIIKSKIKEICKSELGPLANQSSMNLIEPRSSIKIMTFSINDVSDDIAFLSRIVD